MYVCGGGEEKKKGRGGTWVMGKKKGKRKWGVGFYVYSGKKRGSGKERRKKKT